MGCHCLLQETFLTQGLNPDLLHCRRTLYRLSHQGRSLDLDVSITMLCGCIYHSSLLFEAGSLQVKIMRLKKAETTDHPLEWYQPDLRNRCPFTSSGSCCCPAPNWALSLDWTGALPGGSLSFFATIAVILQLRKLLYLFRAKQKLEAGHSGTPTYVQLLPLGGRLIEVAFIHHLTSPLQNCGLSTVTTLTHYYMKIRDRITPVHIIVLGLITGRSERGQKSICSQNPWN